MIGKEVRCVYFMFCFYYYRYVNIDVYDKIILVLFSFIDELIVVDVVRYSGRDKVGCSRMDFL